MCKCVCHACHRSLELHYPFIAALFGPAVLLVPVMVGDVRGALLQQCELHPLHLLLCYFVTIRPAPSTAVLFCHNQARSIYCSVIL